MQLANVGSLDRMIRIILGAVFVALPLLGLIASASSTLGIILMVVGVVLVVTGFVSFCPLYRIIGASTRAKTSS